MIIKSSDRIAGFPILPIRDFLRKRNVPGVRFSQEMAADALHVSESLAHAILMELKARGYVELKQDRSGETYWTITHDGSRFSLASAAPPIRRATAKRILQELVERIRRVNENPYYLYRVSVAVVFGSYLSDVEQLGDIDVALTLEPKEQDPDKHKEVSRNRYEEAAASGRDFPLFTDALFWPQIEVVQYLKSRSRSLHFAADARDVMQKYQREVIYPPVAG